MATLRNQRKLAAFAGQSHEEHPRKSHSRNTPVSRVHEDYFTQALDEIKVRVTKILSQNSNNTESRILSAMSKLDESLLNSQVRVQSGMIPGTSRKSDGENQEPNEDRFQKVDTSVNRSPQFLNSDSSEVSSKSILVERFSERIYIGGSESRKLERNDCIIETSQQLSVSNSEWRRFFCTF